jgi:hypothetical protein
MVISIKVSKPLDCLVVALPGVGHMPATGGDEQWATGNVSELLNT